VLFLGRPVRTLVLVVLVGCQLGQGLDAAGPKGSGSGSGSGSDGAAAECTINTDCVLTGVKCSDCTFAVPKTDPAYKACGQIKANCPANVEAACELGRCVLACMPMACDLSCADGYVIDRNGCTSCACA